MSVHLGVVRARSTLAIVFMIVVLPALGGETIRPRWPLPIGEMRSMIRPIMLAGRGLELEPLLREQRGQLLELGPVLAPVPGRRR